MAVARPSMRSWDVWEYSCTDCRAFQSAVRMHMGWGVVSLVTDLVRFSEGYVLQTSNRQMLVELPLQYNMNIDI